MSITNPRKAGRGQLPAMLLLVATSVCGEASGEGIYMWKDARNVTTFSQLPPAHGEHAVVLARTHPGSAPGDVVAPAPLRWRTPPAQRATEEQFPLSQPADTPAQQEAREALDGER